MELGKCEDCDVQMELVLDCMNRKIVCPICGKGEDVKC